MGGNFLDMAPAAGFAETATSGVEGLAVVGDLVWAVQDLDFLDLGG